MKYAISIIFAIITTLFITITIINKKKTTKNENEFSEEKWNKMIDMWSDFELDDPIKDVLTYDAEINNGGHLQFFENCHDNLDEMLLSLKNTLPSDIYNNLKKAYDIYASSNTNIENVDDYVEESSKNQFSEYDTYYYNNTDKINEILKNFASTLKID